MNGDFPSKYQFPGSFGGVVTLTFERAQVAAPGYVLVLPWYKGQLLIAKHNARGWEVPGGTIEPGEMPIQAVIRETFEETGAELDAVEWIGQYTITGQQDRVMVKSIYIARVGKLHPLPADYETDAVQLCSHPPDPAAVRRDTSFSPIMQDDVYPRVLTYIEEIQHPFTRQT